MPPGAEAAIFSILPEDSLHVLFATNKQLRQAVHDFVTSLRITQASTLVRLTSWPSLTSLNLSDASLGEQHVSILVEGCLPHLQFLDLSLNDLSPAAVQQLAMGDWSPLLNLRLKAICHGPKEATVAACCHLAAGKWPQLTALDFSNNVLPPEGFSQLANGLWPQLHRLDVSGQPDKECAGSVTAMCKAWTGLQHLNLSKNVLTQTDLQLLGTKFPDLISLRLQQVRAVYLTSSYWALADLEGMEALAVSHWPRLAHLDLRWTVLEAAHFHRLAKGDWPQLTSLQLGGYSVPPLALPEAGHVWRSLRRLELLDCRFWIELEDVFVLTQMPGQSLDSLIVECSANNAVNATPAPNSWPCDTQLHVGSLLYRDSEVLQSLSQGIWPITSWTLEFGGAAFDVRSTVQILVKCSLSQLQSLSLSLEACDVFDRADQIQLSAHDAESICQTLAGAAWPALERFTLDDCILGDKFGLVNHISVLATGRWPFLKKLTLTGHCIHADAVQQLVHGNWPHLNLIDLRGNFVKLETEVSELQAKWPKAKVLVS